MAVAVDAVDDKEIIMASPCLFIMIGVYIRPHVYINIWMNLQPVVSMHSRDI